MGWTDRQIKLFMVASRACAWTDYQRYVAMRAAGCPVSAGPRRPSAKHPRNDDGHFERVMAIAESCAASLGATVPSPSRYRSWSEACRRSADRMIHKMQEIADEAKSTLPRVFGDSSDLVRYVVQHTAASRTRSLAEAVREGMLVEDCADDGDDIVCSADPIHISRALESLKAYVGRELLCRGIEPRSFRAPPSARRRALPLASTA